MLLGCGNGQDGDVRGQLAGNDSITAQSSDDSTTEEGAGCTASFDRPWVYLGSRALLKIEISSRTWPVTINQTTTWYYRFMNTWIYPEARGLHEEVVTVSVNGIENTCTAKIQVY